MDKRISWISVLKGFNILLVVLFHVQLVDMSTGTNHPFCEHVGELFGPFFMPLFFFTSGGLLYLSRIKKSVSMSYVYVDKIRRLIVPFLFFIAVYYLMKSQVGAFVKTPVKTSLSDFLENFIFYSNRPSAPFWFLITLFECMLLYPCYRLICGRKKLMMLSLVLFILFYFVDFSRLEEYNYFNILNLNKYLIYFFLGIIFFEYNLLKYLNSYKTFVVLFIFYIGCFITKIPILTGTVGVLLSVSVCMIISEKCPTLFSSFRNYSYQIYLMSMPCQAIVELLLWKHLFYCEPLFPLFYVLNVLFGVYIPVFISKGVKVIPNKYIRMCFGLK